MSIAIGPITLADPVILAPMSGVTDLPFRRLVKSFGAGLVVSEMIASEAMIRQTRQSMAMAANCAEEQPMAVQLAGCEPAVVAEAARLNADRGAAIIDINFGCPVKKVVNGQAAGATPPPTPPPTTTRSSTIPGAPRPLPQRTRAPARPKPHPLGPRGGARHRRISCPGQTKPPIPKK